MDQSVKEAGTEGKVVGYFCQLPPLNENTAYTHLMNLARLLLYHKIDNVRTS